MAISPIAENQAKLVRSRACTLDRDETLPSKLPAIGLWVSAGEALLSVACFAISRHGGGMSFIVIGLYAAYAAVLPLWHRLTGKYS